MNQYGIAVFGLTALWLTFHRHPLCRKWSPIVGLCGQPFWLMGTWGQWGMFALSCAYTFVYICGAFNQWVPVPKAFQATQPVLTEAEKKILSRTYKHYLNNI